MKAITIGTDDAGKPVKVDPLALVEGRALIQANSGGGKSYLLRGIAEQTAGHVQTIIVDPEGEFATLREAVDVLLVGGDGADVPATVRGAAMLARRLGELQVSAVVDVYALDPGERRAFVAAFAEALLSLPKSLWLPRIVAVDEVHKFAPEGAAAVSKDPLATLASQGRKRGIGLVGLTQRLSKLDKDVAAELTNVFIGRTWLPNDQARAGDVLGIAKPERVQLRDLDPGQFVAFGPALVSHNGLARFRSAAVKTTHPKAGQRHKVRPPKASGVIADVAAALADLPAAAEAELRDVDSLRARVAELEREAKRLARVPPGMPPPERLVDAGRRYRILIANLRKGLEDAMKTIEKATAADVVDREHVRRVVEAATGQIVARAQSNLDAIRREARPLLERLGRLLASADDLVAASASTPRAGVEVAPAGPVETRPPPSPRHGAAAARPAGDAADGDGGDAGPPNRMARAFLTALAQHPKGLTKAQILLYANYKQSGDTSKAFGTIGRRGWVAPGEAPGTLVLTGDGRDAVGPVEPLPLGAALRKRTVEESGRLVGGIMAALFDAYPESRTKAEILEAAGYKQSGDTSAAFGRVARLGWTKPHGRGLRASDDFYEPHERRN